MVALKELLNLKNQMMRRWWVHAEHAVIKDDAENDRQQLAGSILYLLKGELDLQTTGGIQHLKSYIGGMVLQQWDFADKFTEVAKHAYDWNRKVEKADYCDLVQVALMHSLLVGGEKIKSSELSNLPAFKRLGFDKVNLSIIFRH